MKPIRAGGPAGILAVILFLSNTYVVLGASSSANTVGVLVVGEPLTSSAVEDADDQIDKLLDKGCQALIFEFEGTGRNFDTHARLGRRIAQLSRNDQVRTIAYVQTQALGLSLLGVLACKEIYADEFAQIGKVQAGQAGQVDQQQVVHLLTSLCNAADHDVLVARAMADPSLTIYRIRENGGERIIDEETFRSQGSGSSAWTLIGNGPFLGNDQTLLLSGQEALEIGLAAGLAGNREKLMASLNLREFRIDASDTTPETDAKSTTQTDVREMNTDAEGNGTENNRFQVTPGENKAVVIVCDGMIDDGLYESIKRRTEAALADGATYIIYEIDTFGGLLKSAIDIWTYFMNDVGSRAHTVAYVPTKAISAGALISVACNDIIMREATQIGDCAPISPGQTLEETEREKAESPTRSYFTAAAEKNGYPVALCKAMVTIDIEVYQVKNLQSGEMEYFEGTDLPTDAYQYDLDNKKLIIKNDELLTVHAEKALELGLCRAVVADREAALAFLEQRDKVSFTRPVEVSRTNWSEEMVRWLTSPGVSGVLLMVALLAGYMELQSPGLGIPGLIAVVCVVILVGSKFLIGLANWWEIALFFVGIGFLLIEIFVLPGFGIFGIAGVIIMLFAVSAMLIGNTEHELPVPQVPMEWEVLQQQLAGAGLGLLGFIIGAYFITRYMQYIPIANKMVLAGPQSTPSAPAATVEESIPDARVGQTGITVTPLRPSGTVKIKNRRVDVVSRGEMIDADVTIRVVEVEGNRIVVIADNSSE